MKANLKLFNSLSKKIEPFTPQTDEVTIYVCGITPYDTTHLGHIFTYVASDILIRYLLHRGYRVKYVQNLTDIDDPIFREANKTDENWKELGERWTVHYIEDMKTLNVLPPDEFPRATEVIQEIIETIQKLLEAGVAYESGGSVFFEVDKWEKLGKLSEITREEMLPVANERGNDPDDPNKRNPLDFALWRAQKSNKPAWDSPWGPGRPGWHIECSTMSSLHLGETIDIHGGGYDLIFPHHEGEIAQSECATGKAPFVRYWFHTAMVRHQGEKMSKSVGNLIMVRDLLKEVSPDGLRIYLASHHYRKPWEFNSEEMKEAEVLAKKVRQALKASGGPSTAAAMEADSYRQSFLQSMDEDLQTQQAIQILSDLANDILKASEERCNLNYAKCILNNICQILGLQAETDEPEEEVVKGWDKHLQKFQ